MNDDIRDELAKEAFGMTRMEATRRQICISCRLLQNPDLYETDADRAEYKLSALCPACFNRLFGDEEGS